MRGPLPVPNFSFKERHPDDGVCAQALRLSMITPTWDGPSVLLDLRALQYHVARRLDGDLPGPVERDVFALNGHGPVLLGAHLRRADMCVQVRRRQAQIVLDHDRGVGSRRQRDFGARRHPEAGSRRDRGHASRLNAYGVSGRDVEVRPAYAEDVLRPAVRLRFAPVCRDVLAPAVRSRFADAVTWMRPPARIMRLPGT